MIKKIKIRMYENKRRRKEIRNQRGSDLHSQSRQDKYYRRWEA